MAEEREPGHDFVDEAAEALEESRRRAAEEGRTIEDQPDPLAVDEDEEEGEITAY